MERKGTAENYIFQSVRLRYNWQTYVSLTLLPSTKDSTADYEAELLHSLVNDEVC